MHLNFCMTKLSHFLQSRTPSTNGLIREYFEQVLRNCKKWTPKCLFYIKSQDIIIHNRYNRASRVVEGGTEYTVRYCHKKNRLRVLYLYMPLVDSKSTAGMHLAACPSLECAPLMAVMEDLSKEKHRW